MNTPTPLTDAASGFVLDANDHYTQAFEAHPDGTYVPADFARELECQLAESRRETERLAALVFEQAKELAESKRLHKEACAANETWERELSAVMPAGYKDWWQNSKAEWPVVARLTIENLRKREEGAWAMMAELQERDSD
jgi:hypothetical protein